ncbi:hypothetical protein E0500_021425 [Streptomyces sp. KM273126]|uniref:hypothetical protein n=1 Tax=Streptomyces sp. KM273126 TaxID=2545247 RepID=UPI00103B6D36|nr:hypothetical protein [Streptomyces sp. KM273126]MBA2809890.1 hypothetical protein [Streptomyces sp. KM273126]
MADEAKHGVVGHVRRFFWLPRGTPRDPAPAPPLLRAWLRCLVVGAFLAQFTWDEEAARPVLMTVFVGMPMLDLVIKGVRNRWPAFVAAWLVLGNFAMLASAAVPALTESLWGEFAVFAPATAVALATFVGVTRLPWPRRS